MHKVTQELLIAVNDRRRNYYMRGSLYDREKSLSEQTLR